MKVLVTGFDPFGGERVNPAYEAVKALPDTLDGAQIYKRELPTAFARSAAALEEYLTGLQPDIVLCVGQAGGTPAVRVERVAINLADARIPDNDGAQPLDEPLRADGDAAYFSTLPVRAMVQAVRAAGLPCSVSYTAGTYVCNAALYNALYLAAKRFPGLRAGFVHVPYLPRPSCRQGRLDALYAAARHCAEPDRRPAGSHRRGGNLRPRRRNPAINEKCRSFGRHF